MKKLLSAVTSCFVALALQSATYYPITINYEPTGTVADFPVLVRIPAGSPIYDTAGDGGANLRFTDALGVNNYPHEVDTWNASGESLVWVKIPELKKGFEFRLYCEGADTTAAKDVWSDYAGVWHLNEAIDSADKDYKPEDGETHTTKFYDCARVLDTAVVGKGLGSTASTGAAFASQVYDNRNGYKKPIHVTDPSKFTVSCWLRVQSVAEWTDLFGPVSQNTGNTGWKAEWTAADGKKMRLCQFGGNEGRFNYFDTPTLASGWHKIDAIWNAKSLILYIDGVFLGQKTDCPGEPTWFWTGWMGWGGCIDGSGNLANTAKASGTDFDECRIYDGVKTADRIAADYATINVEDFLTIGDAQGEAVIPEGTVAQVGANYYQDFAEAVAASKDSGEDIMLMANGQSWKFTAENESINIKLNGMEFTPINGLDAEDYYVDVALDSETQVTTFTLKKQVKVAAMRNVAIYKQLYTRDLAELLPLQVAGLDADGGIIGQFDVVWDVDDITKYDHFGVTQVPGLATVGGEQRPVTAYVRATLSYSDDYHNIAQDAASMHAVVPPTDSHLGETDELKISKGQNTSVLTNGLPAIADAQAVWPLDPTVPYVNWGTRTLNPYMDVAFTWSEPKNVYRVEIYCTGGNNNTPPESIDFTAGENSLTYSREKKNSNDRPKISSRYNMCYEFDTPVSISDLKIAFKQPASLGDKACVNLLEILVWSDGGPMDKNEMSTSAELVELEMDGKPVGLVPGMTTYLAQGAKNVTLAKGEANVAVTVLPEKDGIIKIITMGEDGSSKTYKIKTRTGFTLYVK